MNSVHLFSSSLTLDFISIPLLSLSSEYLNSVVNIFICLLFMASSSLLNISIFIFISKLLTFTPWDTVILAAFKTLIIVT